MMTNTKIKKYQYGDVSILGDRVWKRSEEIIIENNIKYKKITAKEFYNYNSKLNNKNLVETGEFSIHYIDEQSNKTHRELGPAYISNQGQDWWYQGEFIRVTSKLEFEKFLKLKAFL